MSIYLFPNLFGVRDRVSWIFLAKISILFGKETKYTNVFLKLHFFGSSLNFTWTIKALPPSLFETHKLFRLNNLRFEKKAFYFLDDICGNF